MALADSSKVIAALLGLTFATGVVDAASVLGPGHVFTANMTGNVVYLAFALAGRGVTPIGIGVAALSAFLAGAAISGRLGQRKTRAFARAGLLADVALLGSATAAALAPSVPLFALYAPLAMAMGLRTALVRKLAVPDLPTTVLSLTLTGLAADSSLAGGDDPRWKRRAGAALLMFAGALAGALLLRVGLGAALVAATAVELGSAILLLRALPAT